MEILTTKDLHSQLNTWMIHEILLGDVFFGLADAAAEFLAATDGGTFFILQVDLGIYYSQPPTTTNQVDLCLHKWWRGSLDVLEPGWSW